MSVILFNAIDGLEEVWRYKERAAESGWKHAVGRV
jgi:hypothetical protein